MPTSFTANCKSDPRGMIGVEDGTAILANSRTTAPIRC